MAVPAILMSVAGGLLSGLVQKVIGSSQQSKAASQTLGKEDFLKLLTTQLSNQDPLNPISNEAFIAQTAQFSSLEQLQNMNKTLEQLLAQGGGTGATSTAALLGRTVTVNGSPVTWDGLKAVPLAYRLPAAASSVALQVRDASGAAVRTVSLGPTGAGPHQAVFDGLDDQGRRLPAGAYTYQVVAMDKNGVAIPGATTGGGLVTGIGLDSGQIMLVVGSQQIPVSSVVGIATG